MSVNNELATFRAERVLPASCDRVFEAFSDADQLATWWGPDGFTNSFEVFEFETGGRWLHVMHGPNGVDYPNESFFREVVPGSRIVMEHVVEPHFMLTVTLTPVDGGTLIKWVQELESAETAAKMRAFAEAANQQVLDRLQRLLENGNG